MRENGTLPNMEEDDDDDDDEKDRVKRQTTGTSIKNWELKRKKIPRFCVYYCIFVIFFSGELYNNLHQTRCPLLLVADYRFFNEMGGGSSKTTVNYLISLIDRLDIN